LFFSYSRRLALTVVISSIIIQILIEPVFFQKILSYLGFFSSAVATNPEEVDERLITPAFIVEMVLISIIIFIFCLSFYLFFRLEWKKRIQIVGLILLIATLIGILRDPSLFWHTLTGLFD